MLAGTVGRREEDSVAPCLGRLRKQGPANPRRGRRAGGKQALAASDPEDPDAAAQHEDEADDEAQVPNLVDDAAAAAEYEDVFEGKPTHDAVLEVACHLARLMGKLCGDNGYGEAGVTDESARSLGREAYYFVTRYMRVLYGQSNTTKSHALAYHLCDELMRRGNLVEADTSVNEMLHKLLKAFFENTNKHPTSFQVQMMRCEQTLFQIVAEDLKDGADRAVGTKAAGGTAAAVGMAAAVGTAGSAGGTAGSAGGEDVTSSDEEQGRFGMDEETDNASGTVNVADDDAESDAGSVDDCLDDEEDVADRQQADADALVRARRRVRVYGRRTTVGQVMAADGGRLRALSQLLGVAASARLVVPNSSTISASLPWRKDGVRQIVRAARKLYRWRRAWRC